MKKNSALIYITSGILSATILAYMLYNLDWEIFGAAFSDIRWEWLGMALLVYLINIALRARRFANLIYSRPVHWTELIPVSALHNILVYLMPAQTGDVTYILIAKNRLDVPFTEGTATLLASRFYDFSIVTLMLAILLPFSRNSMPLWIYRSSIIFCAIVFIGVVAILGFLRSRTSVLGAEGGTTIYEKNILARIRAAFRKFIAGLQEIQSRGANIKTMLLTAGIWMCIYFNYYAATQSMGLPISFYHIVIISIVMIPLTLLPLQGFANIGTHEVGWTSVLVAFNYPYETALAIAVASHFVLLISVLVSGSIAFFGAQFIKNIRGRKHD